MSAIPSFTTSAVNRYDLLDKMLASVDVPVDRGLVCINGPDWINGGVPADLALTGQWKVIHIPHWTLGWPGVLNFGIARMPDAPWWFFTNNDLHFTPGTLAVWAERMNNWPEHEPVVMTHRWAAFAMNRAVVERIGLFDEWSFWPLYFDDTDYAYRCSLAAIPVLNDDYGVIEGDDDFPNSLTTHSDIRLQNANNRTWIVNQAAYVAKWGGRPGKETFRTPWNLDLPLWACRPSVGGRVEREWPS